MFKYKSMSETRARAKSFDAIIRGSTVLLEAATGDVMLSEFNEPLSDAISTAFLPNVRHGVISVPKKYRDTSGYAVIPHTPDEDTFVLDSTALQPMPQEMQRFWGRNPDFTGIVQFPLPATPEKYEPSPHGSATHTSFTLSRGDWTDTILCRPNVFISSTHVATKLAGFVALHEFVHAIDSENWEMRKYCSDDNDPTGMVIDALELHAYALGAAFMPFVPGSTPLSDVDFERAQTCKDMWLASGFRHNELPGLDDQMRATLAKLGATDSTGVQIF